MPMITKIQQGGTTYDIGIPSGLTESEQAQIRENIGAISESEAGVVVDGTYPDMTVGKALNIQTATVSIPVSGWVGNAATIPVANVTAQSTVQVAFEDNSAEEVITCGVEATSAGEGTITFTCETTPTSEIAATLIILN